MTSRPRSGHLSFAVDARHVRQLGRELVADRVTAVSELIKNAYDADATAVEVTFSARSRLAPGGDLSIRDDGTGMNLEDVINRWMVISTPFKDKAGTSERFLRRRAGQKGIGRFAAETLGGRLILTSTTSGSDERIIVEFDWERDYAAGVRLEEVTNAYRTEPALVDDHGTELRIERLHDPWPPRMLQRVREAVFLLQPPFRIAAAENADGGRGADPGFRVLVRFADEDRDAAPPGDVEDVLAAATAWIEGDITSDGQVVRSLSSAHLGLNEVDACEDVRHPTGPFTFRAAYFIFSRDALNPDASVGVRRAQALAERFGGMRLYRDGLRILPYGEPDNDWLGLDAIYRQRGQVLAPIGNSNFFGEVLITRSANPLLVDTASREGVVENASYEELRRVIRETLIWAVNRVAVARRRKPSASSPKPAPPRTRQQLVDPLVRAAEAVGSATSPGERLTALAGLSLKARAAQEEAQRSDEEEAAEREELLDELSLLRVLASLGGSIAIFSHEVRAVLAQAQGAFGDIIELLGENNEKLTRAAVQAENNLAALADLASYLDLYMSHGHRRSRAPQPLHTVVAEFATSYGPLLTRRGVDIEVKVTPRHLRTAPMARSELDAILFNLLSNSLKALDSESLRAKTVRVEVQDEEDGRTVLIRFLDSGRGFDPSIESEAFDAFVTTSQASDSHLGTGTGLGLKIVSDIAKANGGSASIGTAAPPFVTALEVRLPTWTPDE